MVVVDLAVVRRVFRGVRVIRIYFRHHPYSLAVFIGRLSLIVCDAA